MIFFKVKSVLVVCFLFVLNLWVEAVNYHGELLWQNQLAGPIVAQYLYQGTLMVCASDSVHATTQWSGYGLDPCRRECVSSVLWSDSGRLQSVYVPAIGVVSLVDSVGVAVFSSTGDSSFSSLFSMPVEVTVAREPQMFWIGGVDSGALGLFLPDSGQLYVWPLIGGLPVRNTALGFVLNAQDCYNRPQFVTESSTEFWLLETDKKPMFCGWHGVVPSSQSLSLPVLPIQYGSCFTTCLWNGTRVFVSADTLGVVSLLKPTQNSWQLLGQCTVSGNRPLSSPLHVSLQLAANECYVGVSDVDGSFYMVRFYRDVTRHYPFVLSSVGMVDFESDEGFHVSQQYKFPILHTDGDSTSLWQFNRASVVNQSFSGDTQAVRLYYPYDSAPDVPTLVQQYDCYGVDEVVFYAYASPNSPVLALKLELSKDGGMSYQQDSLYWLTTAYSGYHYVLDERADSLRLRFTMMPIGTYSGIRIVTIGKVEFIAHIPNKKLLPPVVTSSVAGPHYFPFSVTLSHSNTEAGLYYSTDTIAMTLLSSSMYSEKIDVTSDMSLQVMAYASGYEPSVVNRVNYHFEEIDTFVSMQEALSMPLYLGNDYYCLKFDMPVVYSNSTFTYVDDGEHALRFIGDMKHVYQNGDVIESIIVKSQLSMNQLVDYLPLWVYTDGKGVVRQPEVVSLDTLSMAMMNRYVQINGVKLPNSLLFSSANDALGASIITDFSLGQINLRNYFLMLDGFYSNNFLYKLVGIVGDYGGNIHLYPLSLTPDWESATNMANSSDYYLENGVLHICNCINGDVCIYDLHGSLLKTVEKKSEIIDLKEFKDYHALVVIACGKMYKILL